MKNREFCSLEEIEEELDARQRVFLGDYKINFTSEEKLVEWCNENRVSIIKGLNGYVLEKHKTF